MENITIRSLAGDSFDKLFTSFSEAFKDYEMQLGKKELETMLRRRGFNQELSFGAYQDDRLVSFTFNGTGMFKDKKTAYDTGTGTIEEFRGRGLAGKVFEHSIPYLKQAGIEQYLLEVLQYNSSAVNLYKRMGFKISREFNYYTGNKTDVLGVLHGIPENISISYIHVDRVDECIGFMDFIPSWQNSIESVKRNIDGFCILGAFLEELLCGYLILEKDSGDITQIAVGKKFRRKGIGTNLLSEAMSFVKGEKVKCINVEPDCISLDSFLRNRTLELAGKQYEMIRELV